MTEITTTTENSFRESCRESVGNTFNHYLKPIVKDIKTPNIISVGCGFGFEAKPLVTMFPDAHYLGIDVDPNLVYGAKLSNKDVEGDVQFQVKDARNQEAFGDKLNDLVVIRHPQMEGSLIGAGTRGDWETIIRNAIQSLKTNGVLVATVSSPAEERLLKNLLADLPIQIVVDEVNKFASDKGTYDDRVIEVGKKV